MRIVLPVLGLLAVLTLAGRTLGDPVEGGPPLQAGTAAPPALAGTTWEGTDSDGDRYVITFGESGALRCTSPSGTFRNGAWKRDGASITLEIGGGFAVYRGTRRGDCIAGKATNRAGRTWAFQVFLRGRKASSPLSGTAWTGETSLGHSYVFRFLESGALHYTTTDGTFTRATWKQDGASIAFEMNDGFAEYRGEVRGDRMEGTAKNRSGATWTWSARKGSADEPPPAVGLLGTTWAGTDSDGDAYTFRFLEDGALEWTTLAGTFRNGTWEQQGARVVMKVNDGFATYRSEIRGDRLEGSASNTRGRTWTFRLRRVGPHK